jgi:hypothetical protein
MLPVKTCCRQGQKVLSMLTRLNKLTKPGKGRTMLVCLALLIFLAMLPLRMGEKGNSHILGLSWVEGIAQSYCAEQLPKVAATTATTFAVSGVLAMAQDLQIPVIHLAPGKLFSGAHDLIKKLSSLLVLATALLFLGATVMSMLTFICFKLLIPAGLLCRLLHAAKPEMFAWAGKISRPLLLCAAMLWLYFPATALLNGYVHSAFLDERLAAQMALLETDKAALSAGQEEILRESGQESSLKSDPPEKTDLLTRGLGLARASSAIGEASEKVSLEKIKNSLSSMSDLASNYSKRLMEVVLMFLLTTLVIPLGVLLLFIMLYKSLNTPPGQAERLQQRG